MFNHKILTHCHGNHQPVCFCMCSSCTYLPRQNQSLIWIYPCFAYVQVKVKVYVARNAGEWCLCRGGSSDWFKLHVAFCLSLSLCLEALKHPVKRKICEEPKLDIYIKEARRVFIGCMSLGNLVLAALDLPGGEHSSCEKILEQQAGNAWLIAPVKRWQLQSAVWSWSDCIRGSNNNIVWRAKHFLFLQQCTWKSFQCTLALQEWIETCF